MTHIKTRLLFVVVVDAMFVTLLTVMSLAPRTQAATVKPLQAAGFGNEAKACIMATSTLMTIGKDIPSFVAATSSRRAKLTVQIGPKASSTIALNFNGTVASSTTNTNQFYGRLIGLGAAANNAGTGINGMATTSPQYVAGLATDEPYTGMVSAVALDATTTVFVTECVYN